ncbi:hypothetical protein LTR37_011427 [Vermiconidia calcicola]|uniref:Uncharacterized protein n=1 Tax=Vermiconidia calcicola TaxID=1690605 RepID=A0ACC3N231_9PEZI|nr:hypothetical protein LTR37_011427 [Vermiconidia calcicola]
MSAVCSPALARLAIERDERFWTYLFILSTIQLGILFSTQPMITKWARWPFVVACILWAADLAIDGYVWGCGRDIILLPKSLWVANRLLKAFGVPTACWAWWRRSEQVKLERMKEE